MEEKAKRWGRWRRGVEREEGKDRESIVEGKWRQKEANKWEGKVQGVEET